MGLRRRECISGYARAIEMRLIGLDGGGKTAGSLPRQGPPRQGLPRQGLPRRGPPPGREGGPPRGQYTGRQARPPRPIAVSQKLAQMIGV